MASKPVKVLLASAIACGGPLLLAGLRIASGAPGDSASQTTTATTPVVVAAADADTIVAQPAPPRSQPAASAPVSPTRVPGWPFERLGRPVAGTAIPTDEEWQQTAALFAEISPARWHVYEQVIAKPGRRDRARRYLFARYNELRDLQKSNPNQYQAKIQQVKFEDEIFRLDSAIRAAASPADAESLRAELRDEVMERVNKDLSDREDRLRQLQERLDREKAVLEQDRKRSDLMVERRSNNIRNLADRFRNWAAGRNPDGTTPANRANRNAPPPPAKEAEDKPQSSDD